MDLIERDAGALHRAFKERQEVEPQFGLVPTPCWQSAPRMRSVTEDALLILLKRRHAKR